MSAEVLVLAEIQRATLHDVTLELLTAARELATAIGGPVAALVLSADGAPYAPALAAADQILLVDDPQLAGYAPDSFVAALEQIVTARQPRAVLVGATSIGWDLAPLLAARLNLPLVTGVKALAADGPALRATAALCGGKMLAEVQITSAPAILMVLPGSFPRSPAAGNAAVQKPTLAAPASDATQFDQWLLPAAGDVDITQQEVLVAVGRGIQQKDNIELAEELAQALGGAVCASRPVVDQGWLPPTRQVGKSGMTVKPKLYLALGISGAPEHQEGMQDADLIIAVNTDAQAPIFDVAHYGAEVDVLDLLPALTEALHAQKG